MLHCDIQGVPCFMSELAQPPYRLCDSCHQVSGQVRKDLIIIIIIEGLSLLQSIPPTTANKQTQAQTRRSVRIWPGIIQVSRSR